MRALQKEQVKRLYRHSLKNMLSWAIRRDLFAEEVRDKAPLIHHLWSYLRATREALNAEMLVCAG